MISQDLMAPIMFVGLIVFLLIGYPAAFSLGAVVLFFSFIGIHMEFYLNGPYMDFYFSSSFLGIAWQSQSKDRTIIHQPPMRIYLEDHTVPYHHVLCFYFIISNRHDQHVNGFTFQRVYNPPWNNPHGDTLETSSFIEITDW